MSSNNLSLHLASAYWVGSQALVLTCWFTLTDFNSFILPLSFPGFLCNLRSKVITRCLICGNKFSINSNLSAESGQAPGALLRNDLCHFTHGWQIWLTLSIYGLFAIGRIYWGIIFLCQTNTKNLKARMETITWISWILLNPSLQKNSTKLDKVLGPGISFRLLTAVFSRTSDGGISLSGMVSSTAAEIPKASLAADLCKARRMKSCLLSRSPWKFFQHVVVKCFGIAIVLRISRCFREQKTMNDWVSGLV